MSRSTSRMWARTDSSRSCSATTRATAAAASERSSHSRRSRSASAAAVAATPARDSASRAPNNDSDCSAWKNSVKPAPSRLYVTEGFGYESRASLLAASDLRLGADGSGLRPIPHNQLHDFALGSVLAGGHRWRQQADRSDPGTDLGSGRHTNGPWLIELTDDQRSAGQVIRRGGLEAGRAREFEHQRADRERERQQRVWRIGWVRPGR